MVGVVDASLVEHQHCTCSDISGPAGALASWRGLTADYGIIDFVSSIIKLNEIVLSTQGILVFKNKKTFFLILFLNLY